MKRTIAAGLAAIVLSTGCATTRVTLKPIAPPQNVRVADTLPQGYDATSPMRTLRVETSTGAVTFRAPEYDVRWRHQDIDQTVNSAIRDSVDTDLSNALSRAVPTDLPAGQYVLVKDAPVYDILDVEMQPVDCMARRISRKIGPEMTVFLSFAGGLLTFGTLGALAPAALISPCLVKEDYLSRKVTVTYEGHQEGKLYAIPSSE